MQKLDRQGEALQLLEEHVERLGYARLHHVLALDYRLVGLDAANHVVGLDGEHFLQCVGGAVGFECPHLHLAEALTAELGLTAQRLLCYQRVGADGAGVDLIFHQVYQLHHVDVAHGNWLVELLAGAAVDEGGLAHDRRRHALLAVEPRGLLAHLVRRHAGGVHAPFGLEPNVQAGGAGRAQLAALEHVLVIVAEAGQPVRHFADVDDARTVTAVWTRADRARLLYHPRLGERVLDRDVLCAVENGRYSAEAQILGRPAEVGLEHLAEVHAGGHANGIEDDVDGGAVGQEGHVLFRQNAGYHALVAVSARHLVALGHLAGLGDPDAHQLVDAGGQLGAFIPVEHLNADDLAALAVGHP